MFTKFPSRLLSFSRSEHQEAQRHQTDPILGFHGVRGIASLYSTSIKTLSHLKKVSCVHACVISLAQKCFIRGVLHITWRWATERHPSLVYTLHGHSSCEVVILLGSMSPISFFLLLLKPTRSSSIMHVWLNLSQHDGIWVADNSRLSWSQRWIS